MRSCLALLLLLFPFLTTAQESTPPVPIEFPEDARFLPRNWTSSPISAEITPLTPTLRTKAEKIIERGLSKYPDQIVKRYLNAVCIVGALQFYNVSYGGTYMGGGRKIILVYRESFDPKGFEQRLHHEFSSILLKMNQNQFETTRWEGANPPGFQYRAKGVIEEQNDDRSEATKVLAAEQEKTGGSGSSLLELDSNLMNEGFLTAYNRVSIEQDVNEMTAHLFTNKEMWNFCETYPRIDQKVDILIDFFRKLDPKMDRLYFRNLTRGEYSDYSNL